uniref:PGG domain-containing protein n=1 Tax=Nelumbo nucifera TaxID=4432 RepID=A0A822XPA2_NELNU|nr:TPA_asm: hypothetical protein HUJ06_022494 [Nelumbo nucifera]
MTFQAILSTPIQTHIKQAWPYLAYKNGAKFRRLFRCNTTSFAASLSIILLLVSGLPRRNRASMRLLMAALWVAITAMALTYLFILLALTPNHVLQKMDQQLITATASWLGVIALIVFGHSIRLILIWLRNFARRQRRNHNDDA